METGHWLKYMMPVKIKNEFSALPRISKLGNKRISIPIAGFLKMGDKKFQNFAVR